MTDELQIETDVPVKYDEAATKKARRVFYLRTRAARAALCDWLAQKIERLDMVMERDRQQAKKNPHDWNAKEMLHYWKAFRSAIRHLIWHAGRIRISKAKGEEIDVNVRYQKSSGNLRRPRSSKRRRKSG